MRFKVTGKTPRENGLEVAVDYLDDTLKVVASHSFAFPAGTTLAEASFEVKRYGRVRQFELARIAELDSQIPLGFEGNV